MMTSDDGDGLRGLRAAAEGRDGDIDPRWRALAESRLSADEVTALQSEAEQTDEGRLLWEIYRPFDAAEKQRVHAGVRDRLTRERRKKRPLLSFVPVFIAAAAAALAPFYLRTSFDVAWSEARGESAAPIVLSTPDAEITTAIGPRDPVNHPITEKLAVRGTLLVGDGRARRWDPKPNPTTPDNVIYLAGTRKTVFPCVPAGRWEMVVAVGGAGAKLTEAELLAGTTRSYTVLRRPVVLEGPAVGADGLACTESQP
ncbi:MAG: hypothetical protein QM820_49320 [Minicystis sp.]